VGTGEGEAIAVNSHAGKRTLDTLKCENAASCQEGVDRRPGNHLRGKSVLGILDDGSVKRDPGVVKRENAELICTKEKRA